MFEVEKPRRFHYEPRFYDPEREKWESVKKKYAKEQEESRTAASSGQVEDVGSAAAESDKELEYFEKRVRDIENAKREQSSKLTVKDLFRKREMPTFNYQPRFSGSEAESTSDAEGSAQPLMEKYNQAKRKIKIRRRFDISDTDYMKPVSGTKIIVYGLIVFILISIIAAF